MKQKKNLWLLSLAAAVLLMCNTEPLKTEEPLKLKWDKVGKHSKGYANQVN